MTQKSDDEKDRKNFADAVQAASDEYGVNPENLTAYDFEKLTLLQQSYALLKAIRRFVYRGGLVFLAVIVVAGITISYVVSHLSDSVDKNTSNITKLGETVQKSRTELQAALEQARETSDPTLVLKIQKGLDQIDKMCAQTDCEG